MSDLRVTSCFFAVQLPDGRFLEETSGKSGAGYLPTAELAHAARFPTEEKAREVAKETGWARYDVVPLTVTVELGSR